MFFSAFSPRSTKILQLVAHLTTGVLGEADAPRLGKTLKPRSDVDSVAHEIAIRFLDNVSQVNSDAKLDAPFRRDARIARDHTVLDLDGAAHGVDHAAKLDDRAVAGALDDAAVMGGDRGVDQVAPRRPLSRASVRSSSAPASRLYPTTSATRIAASFRVSLIALAVQAVTANAGGG